MRSNHPLAALLIVAAACVVHAADPKVPTPSPAPTQGATPAPVPTPGKPSAPTKAKPGAGKKGSEKAEYKGPTDTDIRVAYTDRINRINAGTTQYLDPAAAAKLAIKLVKVNIVECTPAEDRTDLYLCSILVEAGVGAGEVEFKRAEIAMVKEKDAWQIQ